MIRTRNMGERVAAYPERTKRQFPGTQTAMDGVATENATFKNEHDQDPKVAEIKVG